MEMAYCDRARVVEDDYSVGVYGGTFIRLFGTR